jgi:hypothetical protein
MSHQLIQAFIRRALIDSIGLLPLRKACEAEQNSANIVHCLPAALATSSHRSRELSCYDADGANCARNRTAVWFSLNPYVIFSLFKTLPVFGL